MRGAGGEGDGRGPGHVRQLRELQPPRQAEVAAGQVGEVHEPGAFAEHLAQVKLPGLLILGLCQRHGHGGG